MSLLKAALYYQKMGFSVIPVKQNKKPLTKWEQYQSEKAGPDQIQAWWKEWPGANIALVTGRESGCMVVDVDTQTGLDALNEFLNDNLITPIAETPGGGWHYYFKYQPGLINKARVITDTDIRTDGGYIVAPPSIGENGKPYAWIAGLSIAEVEPATMPEMLFSILQAGAPAGQTLVCKAKNGIKNALTRGDFKSQKNGTDFKRLQVTSGDFKEGERDQALFHLANCLTKGGMGDENILNYLLFFASHCDPPFSEKEVLAKIESAKKRGSKVDFNIAEEVRDFVVTSSGFFLTSDIHNRLQVTSRSEKKAIVNELLRLHKTGIIERHGNKNGCYRRVEGDVEEMDFVNVDTETVGLWLPFGLMEKVEIMPGNIIVIAGSPDAGKTAFLLNVIRENMRKSEVHYFNSEMGSSELKKRLNNFDDLIPSDWSFKAWERSNNFADVIKPGQGKINIIDFLEIFDNFYEVGGKLAEIHKRLKGAVAIVALQKNPGVHVGLGGYRGMEKPRLYLSMDSGSITIQKAKNWVTAENPNGLEYRFKIVAGCKFIKVQDWHKPAPKT